jgi:ELWxxDGT repeat protein
MRVSDFFQSILRSSSPSSARRQKSATSASEKAEVLEFRALMTAQVTQLGDLNVVPEDGSSDPRELTAIGNTVYFTAADKTHGRELWKKDGASPAVLVKDIFVGTQSSGLYELTAVGSTLFFLADDGVHGMELWKSNGTAAGTVLVKDHVRGSSNWGGGGDLLTNVNGKLFYRTGSHFNPDGNNITPVLISSDGTEAGTDVVTWAPTFAYAAHSEIVGLGSLAIFPGIGNSLWKSNGTAAGTQTINLAGAAFPRGLTVLGGDVYFTAYSEASGTEIWKTNGTSSSQVTSFAAVNPQLENLVNVNGTLYFTSYDAANGNELWKTNGTTAGTVRVKDIVAGAGSSYPKYLTAVGSTLYFSANDGVTGNELWKSNGTAAGTVRVGHSGTTSSFSPRNLTNVGGTLYFTATTNETGYEVWKSDGTAAGTNVYQEVVPGFGTSLPEHLTNVNGALAFSATNGVTGKELWRYDLVANTATVSDVFRGTLNSAPRNFVQAGNNLFFIANIATGDLTGEELWKVNANGTGAVRVKDISWSSDTSSIITQMTNVNGTLFFSANDRTFGLQLWKSDGTESGTVMVSEALAQNGSTYPSGLTNLNGKLIFTADGPEGHELWTSDGTAAGTIRLKDIAAGPSSSSNQYNSRFVVNGSTAYFFADDGINGRELWKTNGTAAGTVLVKDVRTGATSSNPSQLINVGGLLYFLADDGINGTEIWQSNGTTAGTSLVANLDVNWLDQLTSAGGKLYFTANGEIWCRSTPTSAPFMLKEIGQGNWGGDPTSLTAVGSTLFFTAVYATDHPDFAGLGRELWKTDGTPEGTVLVKDIVNIPVSRYNSFQWSSNPANLVNNNGTLYFTANDMIHGQELWRSDGTSAGTKLFYDFTGDAGSSHPENLTVINNRIYLTAVTEGKGREAFAIADAPEGTAGNDVFVLTYGSTNTSGTATLTVSSNGGPVRNLGTFSMSAPLLIDGLGGTDTITIRGTTSNDVVSAGSGGITVNGSLLTLASIENRILNGGAGNDIYRFDADGLQGTYSLDESGGGNDTIDFSSTTALSVALNLSNPATQVVNANLSLNLLSGGAFENVTGGSKDDILTGNSLSNSITGGPGSDSLIGGPGDDSYVFGVASTAEADTVTEATNAGTDTLTFSTLTTDVVLHLGTSLVQSVHANRTLKLNAATTFENTIGGSGNDILSGNSWVNVLTGGSGHDRLTGGAGNDSMIGGPGDDSYVFGVASTAEEDTVTEATNAGTDTLTFIALTTDVVLHLGTSLVQSVHTNRTLKLNAATTFENTIGGSGNDILSGNSWVNVLTGGSGHDRLTGGAGNDSLIGGSGDDSYVFGVASVAEEDTVTEATNAGADTLSFSTLTTDVVLNLGSSLVQTVHANRTLKLNAATTVENAIGGSGHDTLLGNAQSNVLTSNAGNDILVGYSGDDRLSGGDGRDILIGGLGLDILSGGNDDDILIAGRTTSDDLFTRLNDLRTEWISASAYGARVNNLRSGVGASTTSLKAKINVLDDAVAIDTMSGGGGQDWYFRALDDVISDLLAAESVDVL